MYRDLLAAIRAVRGRRPRAAAAPVRGEQARHRGVAGAQLLRPGLPRGDLPRLPAAVGPGRLAGRRAARSSRAARRRAAAGAVRADRARRVDQPRLRGRAARASTGPGRRGPTRRCRRATPYPAVPTLVLERRPRQHHDRPAGARRRVALPALDVRGDREHDPHLGARRPRRLRAADGAALRAHAERGRHELRGPDRRGPDRRRASRAGRRTPRRPRRGRATAAGSRARRVAAVARGHRRRRDPALAAQQRRRRPRPARRALELQRANAIVRFRFRRARFARDVPVSGTATWRLSDGAVRARLRLPGRGRLRARWSTQRPLAVAALDGRLGGRKLRATLLAP